MSHSTSLDGNMEEENIGTRIGCETRSGVPLPQSRSYRDQRNTREVVAPHWPVPRRALMQRGAERRGSDRTRKAVRFAWTTPTPNYPW